MKKLIQTTLAFLLTLSFHACNDNEITAPATTSTEEDMEILSRFVDVNESTGEYFINENKRTRALSYVTGSDWADLEKVNPLSVEKYKAELNILNAHLKAAMNNPDVAYIVYSVEGKTWVKRVKENVTFGFDTSKVQTSVTRAPLPSGLSIFGGASSTTGQFKDESRTINMEVILNANIQHTYHFFEISSPNAKPNFDDNITTPETIVFSGTGSLWSSNFTWTAYWDAQDKNDKMFKWEFKGKGITPKDGFIADCRFSK